MEEGSGQDNRNEESTVVDKEKNLKFLKKKERSRFITHKLEIGVERALWLKSSDIESIQLSEEIGEALENSEVTIGNGHETKYNHDIGRNRDVNQRNQSHQLGYVD